MKTLRIIYSAMLTFAIFIQIALSQLNNNNKSRLELNWNSHPQVRTEEIKVDLAKPTPLEVQNNVHFGKKGVELFSLTKERGDFVSQNNQVPNELTQPILAVNIKMNTTFVTRRQFQVYIRNSLDGSAWNDWEEISFDEHVQAQSNILEGNLVFLDKETKFIQYRIILEKLESNESPVVNSVRVVFISPGATPDNVLQQLSKYKNESTLLQTPMPSYVSRTSWGCPEGQRADVIAPKWTPQSTNVTHLIIHHTAGSNTSSDWPAVVRSIWTDHKYFKDVTGWGDIGYNFLIDPNGIIYQGRSWYVGGNDTPKDIVGAHFCAKNSYTFGTALLGTFTSVSPTSNALTSLKNLLAWKSSERSIDPLGTTYHSPSGLNLKNISGHKNGCSTECPGDNLYAQLQTIRNAVNTIINPSTGFASVSQGVSVSPSIVTVGDNFQGAFTLKETQGSPITFESVVLAVLKSDNTHLVDMEQKNNVTVPANGTYIYNSTQQWGLTDPSGTYKAMARGKVAGGNWFDFTVTGSGVNGITFTVRAQPDLTITAGTQYVTPMTIAAGSNVTAGCSEDNSGPSVAASNIVSLYLSPNSILTPGSNGDIYLGFIQFPSLPANSNSLVYSTNIQIPSGTAPGNYYFFFWADGGQVVSESNDGNNFATVQLTVTSAPTPTVTATASTINPVFSPNTTKPIVSLSFSSISNDPIISSISVSRTGTATNTDVPSATLIIDKNKNNLVDGSDTQLGTTQTFASSNVIFSSLNYTPSSSNNILLLYTLSPSANTSRNTGVLMNSNSIVGGNSTNVNFSGISTLNYPLPIELSSFTAIAKNNVVNIAWQTQIENNNFGFELERQFKDKNSWHKLASISGHGNSNVPQDYSYVDKVTTSGAIIYRLKQIDNNGNVKIFESISVDVKIPLNFSLNQNYPNPFNPSTTIRYSIPTASKVRLQIYDVLGQVVAELVDGEQETGWYQAIWNAEVSSGVYFYRIEATAVDDANKHFVDMKKMLLLK